MAKILNIDTSTTVCSIVLSEAGVVVAEKRTDEIRSHAALITVLIRELLEEHNLTVELLDAIAISKGPGSYTGLRIGVSAAKGMCYAKDIPLIEISTLEAMANVQVQAQKQGIDYLCPMIDARRMEVYCQIFDSELKKMTEIEAKVVDSNSFAEYFDRGKVLFFGNCNEKIKEVVQNKNAIFDDEYILSANGMASLSEDKFNNKEFADVAYFEPFYLKDFVAIKAKNKILENIKK